MIGFTCYLFCVSVVELVKHMAHGQVVRILIVSQNVKHSQNFTCIHLVDRIIDYAGKDSSLF